MGRSAKPSDNKLSKGRSAGPDSAKPASSGRSAKPDSGKLISSGRSAKPDTKDSKPCAKSSNSTSKAPLKTKPVESSDPTSQQIKVASQDDAGSSTTSFVVSESRTPDNINIHVTTVVYAEDASDESDDGPTREDRPKDVIRPTPLNTSHLISMERDREFREEWLKRKENGEPIKLGKETRSCILQGCGCLGIIPLTVIIIALVIVVFEGIGISTDDDIVPVRTALPKESVEPGSFLLDEGEWFEDELALDDAMQQFYEDTGVIPFLYIMPNGSYPPSIRLQQIADDFYKGHFADQKHFLTLFRDNGYGGYNVCFTVGSEAKSVVDKGALDVFKADLEANYHNFDIDEAAIFSLTYANTAEQIMSETKSSGSFSVPVVLGSFILAILIILVLVSRISVRWDKKAAVEELVKTPLKKYSDEYVEELAKKYE